MFRRKKGMDRGRAVHGAKWVYINPAREMIEYKLAKEHSLIGDGWELFKSRKEARRWLALLAAQDAGAVRNLDRQRRINLHVVRPDGLKEKIGVYIADFVYDRAAGGQVVEDVKGYREDLYLWKKRHLEAEYGIRLEEV